MDRKEEINKEIDLLEKRIISLKNERYDIIKKNPIYVGDCFVQFRRIDNAYYKIVKVTDRDIICIMVNHNTIEKGYFICDNYHTEKCSLEEFEEEYNRTLNYITKNE
nr:MAG TPA: hypothetical protein [Caudoviricetes sp.]